MFLVQLSISAVFLIWFFILNYANDGWFCSDVNWTHWADFKNSKLTMQHIFLKIASDVNNMFDTVGASCLSPWLSSDSCTNFSSILYRQSPAETQVGTLMWRQRTIWQLQLLPACPQLYNPHLSSTFDTVSPVLPLITSDVPLFCPCVIAGTGGGAFSFIKLV